MACDHQITRENSELSVTIAEGQAESEAIDFRQYAMMALHLPAAWTEAFVGFKVATTPGGTYQPLYGADGALVQIGDPTGPTPPVAGQTYVAPAELAAARWVKLWSQDGSGNDTNQDADRVLRVDLKA